MVGALKISSNTMVLKHNYHGINSEEFLRKPSQESEAKKAKNLTESFCIVYIY
jgi:hypothetical protein